MKLNFEDEQESESTDNIKISQADFFYNEQIKIDEIYNLKVSIKFIKILSIISIIFCVIFTIFQIFQDYQFSSIQKELNRLKLEIEDLKSNNIYKNENIQSIKDIKDITNITTTKYNIENKSPKINYFTAETSFLKEKFNKEIYFLQECMTETKIKTFEKYDHPKLSIIIPIYKTERYISRLILSIQKQEIKEIEIIFIEDSSNNNNKYQKLNDISNKDKRITILKSDKNKGLLNTYIKGILKAKAKYMLFLEEDGMLLQNLKDIMDIVEVYNRDITHFSHLKGTLNGITFDEKINDGEKSQPEISESYYNENFVNENPLLNKIYKTEIIKKAINNINEFYLTEIFDLHVDSLLYICFCSYVNSYKSFGNYYVDFLIKKEFSKSPENIEKMFNSTIYLAQFIYELKYEFEEIFNQRCMLVINLINWSLNYNIKINIDIEKANKVINKFLYNKDINNENQRKMQLIIRKIADRKK